MNRSAKIYLPKKNVLSAVDCPCSDQVLRRLLIFQKQNYFQRFMDDVCLCISTVFIDISDAVIKHSDKSNLGENGFLSSHSPKLWDIMAKQSKRQKLEASSHISSATTLSLHLQPWKWNWVLERLLFKIMAVQASCYLFDRNWNLYHSPHFLFCIVSSQQKL